ncbi:bacterio-opsin activator domain-containing protein [Haloarchaeobius sp. FL176]|uniref:bacterio-opsin activator domain-containing protein n=1 Tax=Haloarchaeobius sp. FL176 TaxID=2967129 RepID=UPI002148C02E|nr:bacterio-opsin activator domain-containing protein [Haloarchaeobius sp. FL176]
MSATPRILVVDGNEDRAAETATVLTDLGADADIEIAESDDEALSAIGRAVPDCVVSEQELGERTGLELLETIRAVHGRVPVVLCTAMGSERVAERAVAADVDGYVRRETGDWEDRLRERVDACLDADSGTDRLKERALDEAPVGITIADANAPDMPLVYVNESFERLTGYEREFAIGRNCRFLQGEDSDPEAIQAMRDAIEAQESESVELVNYTKDGERFWNRVDIAPVRNSAGEVTHYVGFQTDVTDRVDAERTAEHRAAMLDTERAGLEHLLDRVNGVVQETTRALVESTTRAGIERNVTELLADTDPYTCAWIGEPDLADDSIRPSAIVGGSSDDDALELSRSDGPVARAIETGEVQVATVEELSTAAWHEARTDGQFEMLAAIPLVYRDARYGVLTVYTSDAEALDEREAAILAALGRMVATAVSAAETRRTLTADDIVELSFHVDDPAVFFVDVAQQADATLSYAGSVYRDDDTLGMFFTVESDDPDAVVAIAEEHDDVAAAKVITRNEGISLVEFSIGSSGLLSTLAEYGGDVTDIEASPETTTVEVELPREANARTVVDNVEQAFEGVSLGAYRERQRAATTKQEFIAALEDELTDRQLTALQRAYFGDFFEWPRPTSGDDLAESMGIARSTYHQHLRAAERKLVGEFFDRP